MLNNNPGKAIGAFSGAIIAVLFLTFGWKTFFILLLALIGLVIGKSLDDDISIVEQIKNIFRR